MTTQFYSNNYFNPTQQRLNQIFQQYPQYLQQQQLHLIPVSSVDEARSYIVDMYGTPTFFYNASKNEVYLKQTNKQTGNADFLIFKITTDPVEGKKDETQQNIYENNLLTLNEKIDGLYSLLKEQSEEKIKGGKNV